MSESIKNILESEPSLDDLCNAATLRLGTVSAMAYQVGNEEFSEWSAGIRSDYGNGMAMMIRDVIDLVNQLHKQAETRGES